MCAYFLCPKRIFHGSSHEGSKSCRCFSFGVKQYLEYQQLALLSPWWHVRATELQELVIVKFKGLWLESLGKPLLLCHYESLQQGPANNLKGNILIFSIFSLEGIFYILTIALYDPVVHKDCGSAVCFICLIGSIQGFLLQCITLYHKHVCHNKVTVAAHLQPD